MEEYISILEQARTCEQQVALQLEHIERLHRIAKRAAENSCASKEYAQSICEKLAALENELNRQIDRTVDVKRKALVYISSLSGEEYSVIYGYYMLAKRWQDLADQLYMSERRLYLIRKSAMKHLSERYGKEQRQWA